MVEVVIDLIGAILGIARDEVIALRWPVWFAKGLAIFSYVVSPALAAVAFYLNRRTFQRLRNETIRYRSIKKSALDEKKRNTQLKTRLADAHEDLTRRQGKINRLEADLSKITDGEQKLWNLRGNVRFPEFEAWSRNPNGARVVTVGHLKGGVGKTTLTANLAAYYAEHFKKPVLLVDLDYQGSLTNSLALAAEIETVASLVDRLFEPDADLATVNRSRLHLTPVIDRGWLIPASYPFAATDSRLLMRWLLPVDETERAVDVRYRLAHALLRPEVREEYGLIVFDMPPRLTVGAVNALVASNTFVVPTVLDKLSIEAVPQFLAQMKELKTDLGLDIDLARIVPSMTYQAPSLLPRELKSREEAIKLARSVWGASADMTAGWIPRKVDIAGAAGDTVAYNIAGADGDGLRQMFDPILAEILQRTGLKPPESHIKRAEELRAQLEEQVRELS